MTRAMILAAGLGMRLRPLTDFCAKPALPVRGVPVIAYLLEFLKHHGVTEVIINLHHLPETIRNAVRGHCPTGMELSYSEEATPLGTGGGIRKAREFLMESDPCVVLAGDMLIDLNLDELISRHQKRGDLATLILREDSRVDRFGSIGIDKGGAVRRIAESIDLGQEHAAGVFTGVRIFSARALESLPDRDTFEDLRDWLAPELKAGHQQITGELLPAAACTWEPVGTPDEYLRANFAPPPLSFLNETRTNETNVLSGADHQIVLGKGARIEAGARLDRCVVWDGEVVPADTRACDGVFAQGRYFPLGEPS